MADRAYYATISWDECIIDGEVKAPAGEFTFTRNKLDWIIEDAKYYLEKWRGRGAYLESASEVIEDTDGYGTRYADFTYFVKCDLKGGE